MRYFIFIFAMVLMSNIVRADEVTDCAKIQSDAKRLECFDLLFKKTTKTPKVKDKGQWEVSKEISKIDDTKNVNLTLESSDKFKEKYGAAKSVIVRIACRENTTSLYFWFGGAFMSDNQGGGRLTLRINRQKAIRKNFRISSDNTALGLWSGGTSIAFIKTLFNKDRLLVRFAPFNESSSTVVFNISGIENAIKPLAKACGWG